MNKLFCLAAATMLTLPAFSASFRADLSGSNKVPLSPVENKDAIVLKPMHWVEEPVRQFTLTGTAPQECSGDWNEYTFSFKPETDGLIMISFIGDRGNILITNIRLDGKLIDNGKRTVADRKNPKVPQGFYARGAGFEFLPTGGIDGGGAAKTGPEDHLIYQFRAIRDKVYTFTVSARLAQ